VKRSQSQSIVGEFDGISLGDRRLATVAGAMEAAPGESLVEQAATSAALEATYRFVSNARVIPEALFEDHATKTVERAAHHDSVPTIHDTTEFRFGGAKERTGLGLTSSKKRDDGSLIIARCPTSRRDEAAANSPTAVLQRGIRCGYLSQCTLNAPHGSLSSYQYR